MLSYLKFDHFPLVQTGAFVKSIIRLFWRPTDLLLGPSAVCGDWRNLGRPWIWDIFL